MNAAETEAAPLNANTANDDYIQLALSSEDEEDEDASTDNEPLLEDEAPDRPGTGAGTCYNGQALPPWLQSTRRLGQGKWPGISSMINEEMTRFVDYISPTPEEHQMRLWVIDRMQRVLDSMHLVGVAPKALCFGSFATKLYLPTSDIDMTVMLYREGSREISREYEGKESIRRFLYTLAKHMKNSGFCRSCEVIANARVPIIKTQEMITGVAVDISINADNGVQSAAVQQSFAEKVYPTSLRSIVLVIKQFLAQRSMNEVYTGGIGSYAITLLVVSLLQTHPRVRSGGLDIAKNLGILLIEFFELYGKRFNYDNVCVSVLESGRYLDKRKKGFYNPTQSYLLSIEDPCDTTNDVSKGTFGILRIKQTFGGAYDLISNAVFAYHQTRKYGEPINDTLRESMGSFGRKRIKDVDGRPHRAHGFNDDPWAPVSFLSSILSVGPEVIRSRARLVQAFYNGAMQRVLGVEYQPQLTRLLPSKADVTVDKESDATANEKIAGMDFDFENKQRGSNAELIDISDNESAILVADD
ncbi:hypothetical protein GGI25_001468 [Coemansia spiralis]|uniref:polynucleotide adenylyltransferase n=2 Tax=Coemansia TaxID=4863 RepID=A0A9W8G5N7_9FUNG|nr:hypothetical protein BX070DRAFT_219011 [Coemansia spiralis]KAJ1994808.1 hypothetical protein EDC05_001431 [Coemansia umbellata]KAJ2624490.1 hypothetical protein GGI26_001408 [Coemansia sp. RSA 1358]KAJ2679545.1 hypothetical protein GGI25_001468 [Coemansia spiralis]